MLPTIRWGSDYGVYFLFIQYSMGGKENAHCFVPVATEDFWYGMGTTHLGADLDF